uniref:PHD-type domain-containing protein n=1 Tax=Leersia perrieri TaxID=77586 RepID=A0A0D9W4Y5_9ORYZ
MTPKWSECFSNSYTQSSNENGEGKSSITEAVPSSTSYFGSQAVNRMCSLSAQKKDGNVYKRRKMDKDSTSLTANEEEKEMTAQNCTISEVHSSLLLPITSDAIISNSTTPILEYDEPTGASLVPKSGVNERSSVSSMLPPFMILDKKNATECSSSNIGPTEPTAGFTSARDLCIAILKEDGLITETRTRITTEEFTGYDANLLFPCNTCGKSDHPLKMLICDSCEAAFHLSCCIPRVHVVPTGEWYCLPCFRKKPKSLYGKLSEGKVKPSGNINQRPPGMNAIEYMLKDTKPYVTGVRIGGDFQAEVPEWSCPSSSGNVHFEEPSDFVPADLTKLNCREVLSDGDSDKQVVCGKWRRAPLFVVQSDDWDCSCCLPWDPAHADCAVPQELDTDEVLRQLKYLKNRLVDRNHKPAKVQG